MAALAPTATGIDLVDVPYRGALADLIGGQVQVMFTSVPAPIEYLRGLAKGLFSRTMSGMNIART
jgi:tripartite-type tricarboxylate transporter receptor subunit TctC